MLENISPSQLVYFFFFYSFIGWIVDVLYTLYDEKKLVNRGFLSGPFCPIYAFGALTLLTLLKPFTGNPILVIVGSLLITSSIEYFTGLALETIFKTKWWDYSHKKFNLHGRICLEISIYWALAGAFVFYFIHPQVISATNKIIATFPFYFIYLIVIYFIIDFTHAIDSLIDLKIIHITFNNLKDKYKEDLQEFKNKHLSKIDFENIKEKFEDKQEQIYNNFRNRHQRFLQAFPNIKHIIKRTKKIN